MPNIYDQANAFRAQMLRRERAASSDMLRAYGQAWQAIQAQLEQLGKEYDAEVAAGRRPSQSWLFQQQRMENLLREVEVIIGEFAAYADEKVTAEQSAAVKASGRHLEILVQDALPEGPTEAGASVSFQRLPTEALNDLIGFASDGTPLRTLFDKFGPQASEAIRKHLAQAVALGKNPRDVARKLRPELGGDLVRALRISRTEVLRAYRESSRRGMQEAAEVLDGWVWLAAHQGRTCPACLAMSGTFHTLNERLDGHPNCRCVMVPQLKSYAELVGADIPDDRPQVPSGAHWLDDQPEAVQEEVLGIAGAEAFANLKVDLQDFVGQKQSSRWGSMRHTLSLEKALERSGMPQVDLQAPAEEGNPPAPRLDTVTVRRAIRLWRERMGPDLSAMEVRLLPEDSDNRLPPPRGYYTYAFVTPDHESHVVRLLNSTTSWREMLRTSQGRLDDYLRLGTITADQHRNLSAGLPSNHQEFLADTLCHEQGHTLTVAQVGDYNDSVFAWSQHLPAALHQRIIADLVKTNVVPDEYEIGEVIAEDARRFRTGRFSDLNYRTYDADAADLDAAWKRAEDIWQWLNPTTQAP